MTAKISQEIASFFLRQQKIILLFLYNKDNFVSSGKTRISPISNY